MITIVPISNSYRYTTTATISNIVINFSFLWNRRTKSYFVQAVTVDNQILISNKTIYPNGYLELNFNTLGLFGALYLVKITGTDDMNNWADNFLLALNTAPL